MTKSTYVYQIEFLDHCSMVGGMSEPIPCITWGVIVAESKEAICLATWVADKTIDDNMDTHTILKKAITRKKKLGKV